MVYYTSKGTPYFKECEIRLISQTVFSGYAGVGDYIKEFDEDLGFQDYIDDLEYIDPTTFPAKLAGQICYQSHSKNRTPNLESKKYFSNIQNEKHLSVLEHLNFTFLIWGISRNCSAELLRHRHLSPSEKSQRYCGVDTLRFIERPEFQENEELHNIFENEIDEAIHKYKTYTPIIAKSIKEKYPDLSKRDLRKKTNQVVRAYLPGCTETALVLTGNTRTWLEMVPKRTSPFAEVEIRNLANKIHTILNANIAYNPE